MTSQSVSVMSCVCLFFLAPSTGPEHVCHTAAQDVDDFLWASVCIAETERQGTDHLDLAGMPQRSTNSDSTHTLPTTPEGKKKSKGIKKLFGK